MSVNNDDVTLGVATPDSKISFSKSKSLAGFNKFCYPSLLIFNSVLQIQLDKDQRDSRYVALIIKIV